MSIIDDVYAKVPSFDCKGLCATACGPIACSGAEADRLLDRGILLPKVKDHPVEGPMTCSHLTNASRCGIYDNRPLVCRLFGATPALACPHGCTPKRTLRQDEADFLMDILAKAPAISKPHQAISLEGHHPWLLLP